MKKKTFEIFLYMTVITWNVVHLIFFIIKVNVIEHAIFIRFVNDLLITVLWFGLPQVTNMVYSVPGNKYGLDCPW